MVTVVLLQAALWIWFLGCTTIYRLGKHILVEGMGIKSAEFVALSLYSAGLLLYHMLPVGKWILLAMLILWFIVEFFCHWYFTIFGVTKRKLEGYNDRSACIDCAEHSYLSGAMTERWLTSCRLRFIWLMAIELQTGSRQI